MPSPSFALLFLLGVPCLFAGSGIREIERGWLHLNGYTHHFAVPDANDRLWGAGFTWHRSPRERFARSWEFDAFEDSARKLSTYVGHSWTLPLSGGIRLGGTGALMYHHNFAAYNRLNLLPVAFPFLEFGGGRVCGRFYYIPPVRRASDHQIAFQVLIPLLR